MGFLYSQLFKKLPYPATSVSGKTIIVTGSNTGLGKEASRHFARLGASRLILAVRTIHTGEEAKREIEETTRCSKDVIQVWQLDMGSYASVQKFAERVNNELERLDIFIANAGVAPHKYTVLEDNESSITVNVISTLLLAALIMPKLRATATAFKTRPTLSIVSSEVHAFTKFPHKKAPEGQLLALVNDKAFAEKHWMDQYQVSKLLEIYAVRAIAERNPASTNPVTINLINPGLCKTSLQRDAPLTPVIIVLTVAAAILSRTPEVGSRALFHAGVQGADSHGQYLSDCAIGKPSPLVTSQEGKVLQERVWAELVEKLEKIKPGVTSNFF